MISINQTTKQDFISYKRIIDFSCYIKLERNGIEMKMKNINNSLCKVVLIEFVYKISATENKSIFKIQFKNTSDQEFFIFEVLQIEKIIDKLISDGRMTMVVLQGQDKFNIFLFKTTKEILDNFIKQIENVKKIITTIINTGLNNDSDTKINLPVQIVQPNEKQNNNINNIKKRKLQDLYAQSNNNSNLGLKKFKKSAVEGKNITKINKKKLNLLDLSEDLTQNLFEYVDSANLRKLSLLSKECKVIYDKYIEKLKVRDDIPSRSFNNLLNRFRNLKHLCLGEGKFLKNENFKFFDVDLKNINSLDLSEITNLNESSIRKLFSKTKSPKIFSIKFNFFLESITSAILYIQEFFPNVNEMSIVSDYKSSNMENITKQLERFPRFFHPNLFNLICEIIETKIHLKNLSLFLLNTIKVRPEYTSHLNKGKNLLCNLMNLSINILAIEKVKDLNFLKSAFNLVSLNLNEIVIIEEVNNNKYIKRCNFSQLSLLPSNLNAEEQLNNLTLDFDNDYVEVFISIFSKMRRLLSLSLGEFVNDEILKIISLFCKGINSLTLSSINISDDKFIEILNNCFVLYDVDLRGCGAIQGSCFTEIEIFPFNLKSVKLSLTNFNFYNLIQFLRSKGVNAENYLYKNKNY